MAALKRRKSRTASWKNPLCLLAAAVIWGFAFTGLSTGLERLGTFTFNCIRSLFACAFLLIMILVRNRILKRKNKKIRYDKKRQILAGICCGICVYISSIFQQIGIQYTSVGKSGFIMIMYIVIVPVLGLFFHRKCSRTIIFSVGLAVAGFYFITVQGEMSFNRGDLLTLASSFFCALDILAVGYFSDRVDGILLSFQQFAFSAVLSGVFMFVFEKPCPADIYHAGFSLFYVGVVSCGIGYTLQIIGQNNYNETAASLILCLESVFAALSGWMILGETLTKRELVGCGIIFAAVISAQVSVREREDGN